MKTFVLTFLVLLIAISGMISGSGCANIVPPQGGPRDTLPPVLLDVNPPDSTLNFRGNRITFTFDEYVNLEEVQNNLLFTPTLPTTPDVQQRLKTIVVRLRDTLEPNTTYIFNFGNAIRDYNESNILKNFVYTFSTGPALDSLQLSGKVVLAETGAVDTTLTVILHRSLADSAIAKERPRYVSRLDAQGNFLFKNLPPGTFAIYALGDAGIARRYQGKNQTVAFSDSPVIVRNSMAPVELLAFKEAVTAPASAGTPVPPRGTRPGATENNRLRYTSNITNGAQQDLLRNLVLSFEQPLRTFDSAALSLTTDSTYQPVGYSLQLDSSRKILTILTPWIEGRQYNLITKKEFAEDTLGRRLLKSDTISFNTKKATEYGSVTVRLKNVVPAQNPVLQFVQNNQVVSAVAIGSGAYSQPLFLPGDYELRLLFDSNGNGTWDPGRLFNGRRQPEVVRSLNRRITVKTGSNNDFEVTL